MRLFADISNLFHFAGTYPHFSEPQRGKPSLLRFHTTCITPRPRHPHSLRKPA